MSFSPENELTVRRKLADKAALVANIGFVLPAPVYFADKNDFWATVEPKQTRQELETTPVKLCAIYPLLSEDLPENGNNEPPILFSYEFYLFHERTARRAGDESNASDLFDKKLLKTHSEFVSVWLGLRTEFLGRQQLNLGVSFAVSQTNSLTASGEIRNDAECEFVPSVRGFEVKLRLAAKILLKEC